MKLATVFLFAASLIAHAEVKVSVGEVLDQRSNKKSYHQLDVELKLSGPELSGCKALRVALSEAKDDAGKPLKQENRFFGDHFVEPKGGLRELTDEIEDEAVAILELESPERSAKSLDLDGAVEILLPSNDPDSVIFVELAEATGKTLDKPALKAAGVQIRFEKVEPLGLPSDLEEPERERSYTLSDPGSRVSAVEFCDEHGKSIDTSSSSRKRTKFTVLLEKVPKSAKIYLRTEKSILRVPFKLNAVPLP